MFPTVLKIDVEGFELQVLRGFSQGLQNVLLIIIENGPRLEIVRLLQDSGFIGPYFYYHKEKLFKRIPHRKADDPVFINGRDIGIFENIGLQIEDGGG